MNLHLVCINFSHVCINQHFNAFHDNSFVFRYGLIIPHKGICVNYSSEGSDFHVGLRVYPASRNFCERAQTSAAAMAPRIIFIHCLIVSSSLRTQPGEIEWKKMLINSASSTWIFDITQSK
jgi:hypothetical protein